MAGLQEEVKWGWQLASSSDAGKQEKAIRRLASSSASPPAAKGAHAPSSSSQQPLAAPPLRSDAPGRKVRRRGELPAMASEEDRAEAMVAFRRDVWAPTTLRAAQHKLTTVSSALAKWSYELLPPEVEKVAALGAVLKAGHYSSAASYLTLYRGHAERSGYVIDGPLQRAFRDAKRSCERGLGGPVRARALPLEELGDLPGGPTPWAKGGPIHPRNAMVAGAWFLAREVELSTSRAALAELRGEGTSSPTITWHLPASKADPKAIGTSRTHGCSCGDVASGGCPVHAIWDQLLVLRLTFPDRWSAEKGYDWDLPLFPTAAGKAVEKEAMAETIRAAAVHLKVALASPDLTEQVTGHSLRATGAQGLARAGIDEWAIQLLGRWGSQAIRLYTRQAALERSATWASRAVKRLSSGDVKGGQLDEGNLRGTIRSLLKEALCSFCPGLSEKQAAALRDDVVRELRAQASSSNTAAPSSVPEQLGHFIKNAATGVVHLSEGGPAGRISSWTTKCGWKFAAQSNAEYSVTPEPPGLHKFLCEKCLPKERHSRKVELQRAMRGQGGVR